MWKRLPFAVLCLALWIVGVGYVLAQEKLTLATPVFATVGATDFRVESVYLKRGTPDAGAEIRARFREVAGTAFVAGGRDMTCRYDGDTAETLIAQLNTVNLTTASLEKRVTQRCQADGKLGAGTITGVPQ
jgi:hypothetical protein